MGANAASGTKGAVYLGRPWRNYSRVVFKFSTITDVINKAGWRIWNTGDERTDKVFYGEYQNDGASAWNSARVSFATNMSNDNGYKITDVLGSTYTSWVNLDYASSGTTNVSETWRFEGRRAFNFR